jgi:hypothetical protein
MICSEIQRHIERMKNQKQQSCMYIAAYSEHDI